MFQRGGVEMVFERYGGKASALDAGSISERSHCSEYYLFTKRLRVLVAALSKETLNSFHRTIAIPQHSHYYQL